MIILIAMTIITYLLYNYRVGNVVSKEILKRHGSSVTHYLIYIQIGSELYEKEVSKLDFYFNYPIGYTLLKINHYKGLIYL